MSENPAIEIIIRRTRADETIKTKDAHTLRFQRFSIVSTNSNALNWETRLVIGGDMVNRGQPFPYETVWRFPDPNGSAWRQATEALNEYYPRFFFENQADKAPTELSVNVAQDLVAGIRKDGEIYSRFIRVTDPELKLDREVVLGDHEFNRIGALLVAG